MSEIPECSLRRVIIRFGDIRHRRWASPNISFILSQRQEVFMCSRTLVRRSPKSFSAYVQIISNTNAIIGARAGYLYPLQFAQFGTPALAASRTDKIQPQHEHELVRMRGASTDSMFTPPTGFLAPPAFISGGFLLRLPWAPVRVKDKGPSHYAPCGV